jgi:hypothetical protein
LRLIRWRAVCWHRAHHLPVPTTAATG